MFITPEQLSAATKASLDTRFATLSSLSATGFDNLEQMLDLNLSLFRASMEESAARARQMIAARTPQEVIAISSGRWRPGAQKAINYGKHLIDIASNARAGLTEVAEARLAERSRRIAGMVDSAAKNAPAGSEKAVELIKTAVGNANVGLEQLSKTTRKTVEAMEVNLAAVVSRFAEKGEKSPRRARKQV